MSIRLLLVDDHQMFLEGLRPICEQAGFHVLATATRGRDAVRLAGELQPDVATIDVSMPDLVGLETTRLVKRASSNTRIVLLTMHREEVFVLEAMRAGASGYVLKSQAASDLVDAIRATFAGGVYLSPGVSRAVVDASLHTGERAHDELTPREREVLCLIADGRTTKEVASVLGISVKTAESHRTNLMRRLDLHDVASLVRFAIRRGLVNA